MAIRCLIAAGALLLTASPASAATASCYGEGLWGNPTADGTVLQHNTVGVAHKSLPLGTRLRARVGGNTITVEVIDRGPYVRGRHLDFTQAAAQRLGFADCDTFGVRNARTWRAR